MISVHYGFAYVRPLLDSDDIPDMDAYRDGQVNGLLGAAEPGSLSLVIGTHTGRVPLRIERWATAPPVANDWEEVVEATLDADGAQLMVESFQDTWPMEQPGAGRYRVRFCASGMDEAHQEPEIAPDRYLLQLWPTDGAEPDAIVRLTSETAGYWHSTAAAEPAPPSVAERAAERKRRQTEELRGQEVAEALAAHLMVWGDISPSGELLAAGGDAAVFARHDLEIAEAVALLDQRQQRALTVWTVRRALQIGGLHDVPAAADALAALEGGHSLPGAFADFDTAWTTLFGASLLAPSEEALLGQADSDANSSIPMTLAPEVTAIAAVLRAADPNPAAAVFGSMYEVCSGRFGGRITEELRQRLLGT